MTAIALRRRGEYLPLRGYVVDMGSFPTHKAAIVRLYLNGLTTPDIAARTYHSKEAIDRYIRGFERVRVLAAKFAREELPLLTGMSEPLVDQYLALLDEHGSLQLQAHRSSPCLSTLSSFLLGRPFLPARRWGPGGAPYGRTTWTPPACWRMLCGHRNEAPEEAAPHEVGLV